jgi:hypothetical protein
MPIGPEAMVAGEKRSGSEQAPDKHPVIRRLLRGIGGRSMDLEMVTQCLVFLVVDRRTQDGDPHADV